MGQECLKICLDVLNEQNSNDIMGHCIGGVISVCNRAMAIIRLKGGTEWKRLREYLL